MKNTLVFLCLLNVVHCEKILGVFLFPAYSHQIIFQTIWKDLALKGHEVTVLTTDPINDPTLTNLREIDLHFSYEAFRQIRNDIAYTPFFGINIMRKMFEIINKLTKQQLALPEVQAIIKNPKETFDLVIVEWLFPATYAFSSRFNCPIIGIHSLEVPDVFHYAIGNPIHPIMYPSLLLNFPEKLDFFQRFISTMFSLAIMLMYHLEVLPASDEISRQYIDSNVQTNYEIMKNVSLLLVNKNPFFSYVRPNLPTVIEFSSLHIHPEKPLPKDIQEFLDNAQTGAIYFSLGSNIQSSELSNNLIEIFLQAFAELPYKILWKFENSSLIGLSKNVKISKWLPQQDILGHKNIKLFIMQGGFQSLEETISKRVPVIGIPFQIDQPRNMKIVSKLEIGLSLDKETITKHILIAAIKEVIENPRYHQRISKVAELLEDQPMKPLDKVSWWIEHSMRRRGTNFIHSSKVDLPWYQFVFLDIIFFLLTCIVLFIFVFAKAYILLRRLIRQQKEKVQ